MSDSSVLPTPHPLLTTELSNELNEHILRGFQYQVEALKVTDSDSPASFGTLLWGIILHAKELLQREGLPDILVTHSMTSASRAVEQHPQLRDIIRTACQDGKFSRIIDLRTPFY